MGRLLDHLSFQEQAYRVDPLWPQGVHQYASALWTVGQEAAAEAIWDEAMVRWPELDYLYAAQLGFATFSGKWTRVDAVLKAASSSGVQSAGIDRAVRRAAMVRNWDQQSNGDLLLSLTRKLKKTGTLTLQLHFACNLGLTGHVYALLERARFTHLFEPGGRLQQGDFGLHHLFDPSGRTMRGDVRFVRQCARLGLCDYWTGSGRWPDCAEDLADSYDFRAEARQHTE